MQRIITAIIIIITVFITSNLSISPSESLSLSLVADSHAVAAFLRFDRSRKCRRGTLIWARFFFAPQLGIRIKM